MSTISSMATVVVALGALVWLFGILSLIFNCIVHKKKFSFNDTLLFHKAFSEHKVKFSIIMLIVFALYLAGNKTFLELIGHHSLEYENGGTYCYYVQVTQQHGDNAVYTLPGQIRVEVDDYDDGEKRHYSREYFIEKVFFNDGTYLDFTSDGEDTTLTGSVTLEDQYEEEWKCTIINEHAYSSGFKETTHVTTSGELELLFLIFVILYNWLGCFSLKEEEVSANICASQQTVQKKNADTVQDIFSGNSIPRNPDEESNDYSSFLNKYRKDR